MNRQNLGKTVQWTAVAALAAVFLLAAADVRRRGRQADEVPHLAVGATVDYFDLEGCDGSRASARSLDPQKLHAIFLFSEPCTPCNRNLVFWRKLARAAGAGADVYGVVFASLPEGVRLAEAVGPEVPLYVPADAPQLKSKLRVMYNLAQTLVCRGRRVIFAKAGDLEAPDYFQIVDTIKGGIPR